MSWRASSTAAARPAGPAPTMRTGSLGVVGMARSSGARVRAHEQRLLNRRHTPRMRVAARRARSRAPRSSPRRWRRAAGGVVVAGPGRRRQDAAARASGRAAREARAHGGVGAGDAFGGVDPARRVRAAAAGGELPEGVELLAHARAALAARAAGRRLVLCVDDGQLLDDASAALVHQLVAAGEAFVARDRAVGRAGAGRAARAVEGRAVRAARAGRAGARRRSTRCWPPASAARSTARTAERDVGADPRQRAVPARARAPRARPRAAGRGRRRVALARPGRGRARGCAELVDLRIGDVGAGAREQLEVVAVGGAARARRCCRRRSRRLERAELVERRTEGRRRFVDVAHPLHGEAVRARLTPVAAGRDPGAAGGRRRGARRTPRRRPAAGRDVAPRGRRRRRRRAVRARGRARRWRRATRRWPSAWPAPRCRRARASRAACARRARWPPWGAGRGPRRSSAGLARGRRPTTCARRRRAGPRAQPVLGLDRADDADAVLRDAAEPWPTPALRHELAAQRVRLDGGGGGRRRRWPALGRCSTTRRSPSAPGRPRRWAPSRRCSRRAAAKRRSRWPTDWLPVAERRRATSCPTREAVLLGMRAVALRLAGRLTEADDAVRARVRAPAAPALRAGDRRRGQHRSA